MTFAIDFVGTNLESGTKTYNINFCNELNLINHNEKIVIFICKNYLEQIESLSKKNSNIKYIIKSNFFSFIFFRLIWMQLILPFELKLMGIKKLYSPMNICPIILKFINIKVILGLHSNLPWVFQYLMPGSNFRNLLTKKLMELSIGNCEILLVNSNFAKEQIAEILKLNKEKIRVIYLGVDKKYCSLENSKNYIENFNYKEKYIFSVLSCVKYHNILNLLKAYKILIKEINFNIKFFLVLQILDKKYYSEIDNYIKKNFTKGDVIIKKNLQSKYLINLYKSSQLYIFSSYSEVFGLTSLEAMSQGCPVLISKTSALPEINDIAADYFDPDDIVEIKNKIFQILIDENYKSNLIKNGKKHFKKFTWENNVLKTLEVIENLK